MEKIAEPSNLTTALRQVVNNGGSAGIDGMKVIVLTRGDLTGKLVILIRTDNPYSDLWLNGRESAEEVVLEGK